MSPMDFLARGKEMADFLSRGKEMAFQTFKKLYFLDLINQIDTKVSNERRTFSPVVLTFSGAV